MIKSAKRISQVEEYYFSRKLTEISKIDTKEFPVLNLGIGSPDLPPSVTVTDALAETASNPSNHGYQNYRGILALREAIAQYYKVKYNTSLDPKSMILPLFGSKEGIMHISMAFVEDGDEVLIPNPGYPTYNAVAKLVGGKVRTYDLVESLDWRVDIKALRKADLSKVKLMWVNYPHMPTGRMGSRNELQELVDIAKQNNFLIVNDNPYSLILNNEPLSILSFDGADEVALELNSLSKSHNMAGWRIGWVSGKSEFIDSIIQVKSNMDSGMFLGSQMAAIEALKIDSKWYQDLNKVYSERKKIVHSILDELGCSYSLNQSGLFVWAKIPTHVLSCTEWVDEILYSIKVFLTPGEVFGSLGERFVRISLCSSIEKFQTALSRIKEWNVQRVGKSTKAKINI